MEFILSHLGSSFSNSDKELLEEIVINDQIAMQATIACGNIWEYFTSIELDEESEKLVILDVSVWDILTSMWTTPSLFKFLTNFILGKFGSTCAPNQCRGILMGGLNIHKIFKLKIVGSQIKWKPK